MLNTNAEHLQYNRYKEMKWNLGKYFEVWILQKLFASLSNNGNNNAIVKTLGNETLNTVAEAKVPGLWIQNDLKQNSQIEKMFTQAD